MLEKIETFKINNKQEEFHNYYENKLNEKNQIIKHLTDSLTSVLE